MNKKQSLSILQVALFSFDGATEQEIRDFNSFDNQTINAGISLCNYLKSIKINEKILEDFE